MRRRSAWETSEEFLSLNTLAEGNLEPVETPGEEDTQFLFHLVTEDLRLATLFLLPTKLRLHRVLTPLDRVLKRAEKLRLKGARVGTAAAVASCECAHQ